MIPESLEPVETTAGQRLQGRAQYTLTCVAAMAHLAVPVRVAQVLTCHHKAVSLSVHTNGVVNLSSLTQASDANLTPSAECQECKGPASQ